MLLASPLPPPSPYLQVWLQLELLLAPLEKRTRKLLKQVQAEADAAGGAGPQLLEPEVAAKLDELLQEQEGGSDEDGDDDSQGGEEEEEGLGGESASDDSGQGFGLGDADEDEDMEDAGEGQQGQGRVAGVWGGLS